MMDQEKVYRWLAEKSYTDLREFLFRERDNIKSDRMLYDAAKKVESEFVRLSSDEITDDEFMYNLEVLHSWHPEFYNMENDNYKKITLNLLTYYKNDLKKAIFFAKLFPDEEISQEILKNDLNTNTQILEHHKEKDIQVTHNPIPTSTKASTPLFKSEEERKLYMALRRIFDTFLVYPNVAMSNIINFEAISKDLTKEERDYFFQSVIDYAVFDQLGGYEPIYFIELDSAWHDLDKIEEKDKMKNKIFSVAGLKLIRIRHKSNRPIDENTFFELVGQIRVQLS